MPAAEQPPTLAGGRSSEAGGDDRPDPPAEFGPRPVVDQPTLSPEGWSGPSVGAEWAPAQPGAGPPPRDGWARAESDGWDELEPPGHRARTGPDGWDELEPPGRRARAEPDGWDESEPTGPRFQGGTSRDAAGEPRESSGRRFRPDPDATEAGEGRQPSVPRPAWAAEPQRAYEPGHRSGIRPKYQPSTESAHQPPDGPAPRAAEQPAGPAPLADVDRPPESASAMLPQRVPAEPDVPVVSELTAAEAPTQAPELARIATHLRQADEPAGLRERPEVFDVDAILGAVRGVAGVRDAALRRTKSGAHSLRLELADGADPAEVSRHVARLLQERMGLAAAPQNMPEGPADVVSSAHRQPDGPAHDRPAARTGLPSRNERRDAARSEPPRRRWHSGGPHRGRSAAVDTPATGVSGAADGPARAETSYGGGQLGATELAPSRPLDTGGRPGPRVVLDHVQVSTFGLDATVEVRLLAAGSPAAGFATGPAVDGYMLRLSAAAAAAAVDQLLRAPGPQPDRGRCFVEHATLVPLGNCEVATVVVLLVCDGWVEQLAGSALVAGDPRQAVVRATLAAVNRRLEALLADTGNAG
ncbi:hypothetical protein HW126_16855 [Salinispora sp. H7-4]|nr:hypothetical protein [Salinispora sp. H7-4]NYT95452.1 hypothetical protein [Salinispora sp. H7-4]